MSSVSVIIPVHNAAGYLRVCLDHLRQSVNVEYECIVVADGSTDESAEIAARFGATVLRTDRKRGPAFARNLGAGKAHGEILLFIDADVCVYPDTIARIMAIFEQDAGVAAVIGSYDDSPESKDFLSQYRNLMHCYVHHRSRREACTFWSGCGAIRKSIFHKYSGFDESYERPAIEDIELGFRMRMDDNKILLDPSILVKHLKKWSFLSLVKTDILDRGIPWTELILEDRFLPNDLNLQLSQRVSIALVFILLGIAAAGAWYAGSAFILMLLTLLFLTLTPFWVESTWKTTPKAVIAATLQLAAIGLLANHNHTNWLIPPVLLAYALLFVKHRYSFTSLRRKQITGLVCGIYLVFVILMVIIYLPHHPLIFWFFLLLSVTILLNSQFYVFLAGRTGRLLALGAIPFHLLYHLYNGISFLAGGVRYVLRRVFSVSRKRISISSEPSASHQQPLAARTAGAGGPGVTRE
jgi:glycosyltransferase involved in cell wall biosynthesis